MADPGCEKVRLTEHLAVRVQLFKQFTKTVINQINFNFVERKIAFFLVRIAFSVD